MDEPPGALSQLLQSTGVPIDRYSFETIEIMKDREEIDGWRRELMILRARLSGKTDAEAEASIPLPRLTVHTMDVSFDAIKDSVERVRLMNMPTSFVLPPEDVDRLREIGARLLRGSHDFQDLLREWSGTATP
jgi:NTE family protein